MVKRKSHSSIGTLIDIRISESEKLMDTVFRNLAREQTGELKSYTDEKFAEQNIKLEKRFAEQDEKFEMRFVELNEKLDKIIDKLNDVTIRVNIIDKRTQVLVN